MRVNKHKFSCALMAKHNRSTNMLINISFFFFLFLFLSIPSFFHFRLFIIITCAISVPKFHVSAFEFGFGFAQLLVLVSVVSGPDSMKELTSFQKQTIWFFVVLVLEMLDFVSSHQKWEYLKKWKMQETQLLALL